jgi:hypothetical protein
VYIHVFLASATDGGERLASCLFRFTPSERTPGVLKPALPLLGLELQTLCHPVRSKSLYRLSYPGLFSTYDETIFDIIEPQLQTQCVSLSTQAQRDLKNIFDRIYRVSHES